MIEVEHAGDWDPTEYRSYVREARPAIEPPTPKEKLPPVPRPKIPADLDPLVNKAHHKDLRNRNIK